MEDDNLSPRFVSFCTYYITDAENEEDDFSEITNLFEKAMSVDPPSCLPNEKVNIKANSLQDVELFYSGGRFEPPDAEEYSAFRMGVDSDFDVHIHTDAYIEDLSEIIEMHEEICGKVDEVVFNYCRVYSTLEYDMSEFYIRDDTPEGLTTGGVEFEHDDFWLGIRYDDEAEIIRASYHHMGDGKVISSEEISEIVNGQTDMAGEAIEMCKDGSV